MQKVNVQYYESPCGELVLASVGNELCLCDWNKMPCAERNKRRLERRLDAEFITAPSPIIEKAMQELDEYFEGNRRMFDVPLHLVGTDFQKDVWRELLQIPLGAKATYGEIACRIGKPKAVRAVANAIGANGISILVPCHRVIGCDGTLTGYAGGLTAKKMLLDLETTPKDLPF